MKCYYGINNNKLCSFRGRSVSYHSVEPWQRAVYGSSGWDSVRELVWNRQHGMCRDCGRALLLHGTKKDRMSVMEVHHTVPLTPGNHDDPSVAFDADKLDGLCHDCHEKRHGRLGTYGGEPQGSRRGVWFDEDGMPHMDEGDGE